jgi:hypothetical protein
MKLTPRERILAAFKGKKSDKIVWQPRIFFWYNFNKAAGTLPKQYQDRSVLQVFDDLQASPRSYHFFDACVVSSWSGRAHVQVTEDDRYIKTSYSTPNGNMRQIEAKTSHGQAKYTVEYALKSPRDFEALIYLLEHEKFLFDKEQYRHTAEMLGQRTVSSINLPWLPLQRLTIQYMGVENCVRALWKHRSEVESVLTAIEENNDRRFDVLKKTPIEIMNFGDNIDQDLVSPSMFERYALPYYQKRTKEFHEAGKICTSHWDGRFRSLLPFVRRTGLDALECVAPKPMGDVGLKELRSALGDMVLMDGIPATYFLPSQNERALREHALEVLNIFPPRLVLGIGDMLPPDGEIERVRMISGIVDNYVPP